MTDVLQDLDHTFSAPIGVNVKGETWPCVEVPMPDVGLMVTGRGGHMLSLNAAMRKRLGGKDLGDEVVVRLQRRLR